MKAGRSTKKASNQGYKSDQHRAKNKILRILKSSGEDAAKEYAKIHDLLGWLEYGQRIQMAAQRKEAAKRKRPDAS